ncbi:hypothetical protein ALQ94_101405 [Pseudomonas amygdali pv. morsprunorum]|uniref:Uncharacterized protein n=1 Tax=Pseudomonas amygdali pv. morsprunorum TaxID=129138 RepID=A0A3M2WEA9_PSEA0|nr:hypothetical protein ALQ94_101405 [Pseudomonas amygdali pv. morsprunorum]
MYRLFSVLCGRGHIPGLAYVFWQCATADAWSIRLHFFFVSSPQKNTNVHFALLSISCLWSGSLFGLLNRVVWQITLALRPLIESAAYLLFLSVDGLMREVV